MSDTEHAISVGRELPGTDDRNFGEMARWELRGWIARYVGRRKQNLRTPMTMTTLNSVYAYLTGGFAVPPREINTEFSPGRGHVKILVASEVGIDDYPFEPNPRPFRREELQSIAEKLVANSDKREWV